MASLPAPCCCNYCCNDQDKPRTKRIREEHIRKWGEFGRTGTIGEFLKSPVKPADQLVVALFRKCLEHLSAKTPDLPLGTYKVDQPKGKPFYMRKIAMPSTAESAVSRRILAPCLKELEFKAKRLSDSVELQKNLVEKMQVTSIDQLPKEVQKIVGSKIKVIPHMDVLHCAKMRAKSKESWGSQRNTTKPALKGFVKLPCEAKQREEEKRWELPYEAKSVKVLAPSSSLSVSMTKAGKEEHKIVPMVFINLRVLLTALLSDLQRKEKLTPMQFAGSPKIVVKLFIDSDAAPNTKVTVNVLNQLNANSGRKNYVLYYCDAAERRENFRLFWDMLNTSLEEMNSNMVVVGYPVQFVFCADTNALWLAFGQPKSSSPIHCCPFCEIHRDNRKIPRSRRGLSPLRTLAGNHFQSQRFEDDAPGPRERDEREQRDYFNVTTSPMFAHSPNGPEEDDSPILHWVVVPFLHCVLRIGTDLHGEGNALSRELDRCVAEALKTMPCLISVRGVEEGTDFYQYIMALKEGPQPLPPQTGPNQENFQKACEKTGTTAQVFYKGTLTGNGALAFCSSDLSSYWREALNTSFLPLDSEERVNLDKRWKALRDLRCTFRKVLALVGRNQPVNSPEELAEGQSLVDSFMKGYRGIFPTIPPKLHFLEDHCVQQAEYFGHWPGLYNEHGGESSHKIYNDYSVQFRSVGNRESRALLTVNGVTRSQRLTEDNY